jgi:putative transposase
MTSAPDRQDIIALITETVDAGARQSVACHEQSLNPRTYQRWRGADGEVIQDLRPLAERQSPANRLSEDERDQIVATCNEAELASLPPSQIVPRLADRGTSIASEPSF